MHASPLWQMQFNMGFLRDRPAGAGVVARARLLAPEKRRRATDAAAAPGCERDEHGKQVAHGGRGRGPWAWRGLLGAW